MNTHVVIMAGGIGSRLWPLSTPETPKQFIDILGVGQSLLQLTVERFLPVCPPDRFWVVTSEKYVDIVRQQLPAVPDDQILAEPEARNTAPCIAYACWKISKKDPDANIVVTVGITPSRPETGYGYIHAAEAVQGKVVKVSEFKEKPDLPTAEAYLADGHYFWNAGIFVWKASTIMEEMRTYAPQIAGVMDRLAPSFGTEGETAALKELFPTCEKVSIDYAVMEKSALIHVIAADLGWSDLGSWGSIKEHLEPDADGNTVIGGDVRLFGCKDCFVHAAEEKTVVVEGLEGYIVAESKDRLLVCRLSEEQRIKEFTS